MREGHLVRAVLLSWGAHPGLRIWRQNTGVGWFVAGKPARKTDPGAYPVRFGLPGQGDVGGILANGRRIEIECKVARGQQSEEQMRFQQMIEKFGGLYVLVRDNVTELDAALSAVGLTR